MCATPGGSVSSAMRTMGASAPGAGSATSSITLTVLSPMCAMPPLSRLSILALRQPRYQSVGRGARCFRFAEFGQPEAYLRRLGGRSLPRGIEAPCLFLHITQRAADRFAQQHHDDQIHRVPHLGITGQRFFHGHSSQEERHVGLRSLYGTVQVVVFEQRYKRLAVLWFDEQHWLQSIGHVLGTMYRQFQRLHARHGALNCWRDDVGLLFPIPVLGVSDFARVVLTRWWVMAVASGFGTGIGRRMGPHVLELLPKSRGVETAAIGELHDVLITHQVDRVLGHRREGSLGGASSSFGRSQVAGVEDAVDAKLQEGAGLGHGADQGLGIGAGQLPRIAPSGKG